MSAEILRDAAKVLRKRAEAATSGPWRWEQVREDLPYLVGRAGDPETYAYDTEVIEANHSGECGCRSACYLGLEVSHQDRDYIATMHPGVGLAIAKWLEDVAAGWMWDEDPEDVETPDGWPLTLEESMDMHPLTVARAILGGTT